MITEYDDRCDRHEASIQDGSLEAKTYLNYVQDYSETDLSRGTFLYFLW